MYLGSGTSKHASSTSGSNARPVDSAYASMSSGAHSSGLSLVKQPANSRAKNDLKVESYLRDIPEGLYPRHILLTDKERKKLVVRRLEQLFTGKIGRGAMRSRDRSQAAAPRLDAPSSTTAKGPQIVSQPSRSDDTTEEPAREAQMLPTDRLHLADKKNRSRENVSASNSNGDQTESGGNGESSRSATNQTPPDSVAAEQRPTRVKDLDPDRTQVPSENMEYIRHLGLVPPELLESQERHTPDVKPDADGWVYLNLLCNMAQLHIVNVTPSFVRASVSEMSSKFQLSPDGRKIRWRGGMEGTRFSSESGDNLQVSPDSGDTDDSPGKRQKTSHSTGDDGHSGDSSKSRSKFGPQVSTASESFHYKPLFVHNSSPNGQTTVDDTLSSFGPIEDSNAEDSRWGLSGSGTSNRKKRRRDGAIIYYGGAPFCTDLSGDTGDVSPTTYMLSSGQGKQRQDNATDLGRSSPDDRPGSGASLSYRPLSEFNPSLDSGLKMDVDSSDNVPNLATDSDADSTDGDFEFPWSNEQQFIEARPLEPCGLGGVMPDDHFMVVVTTKRPRGNLKSQTVNFARRNSEGATEGIMNRLATMSTASPAPLALSRQSSPGLEIEYVSGRIKKLAPVPLPPPAIFVPPFSSDDSASDDSVDSADGDDEDEPSEEFMSRQANPHRSDGYPDGVDLSSGDEDGEDPDEEPDSRHMYDPTGGDDGQELGRSKMKSCRSASSAEVAPGSLRRVSKSESADAAFRTGGSSAATAGGVGSDYSNSG